MERITDKLKKLLALAERGYGGEAENARRLLEAQLNKYELTLEDLLNEGKKRRILKYRGEEELRLVIQVLASVLGSKNEVFNGSTYNSSKKQIYIELTDLQFAEISDMIAFYKRQFNKEKKRLLKDLFSSFIQKHHLFDCDPIDKPNSESKDIDLEELFRILQLSRSMEDVTYRKAISNK